MSGTHDGCHAGAHSPAGDSVDPSGAMLGPVTVPTVRVLEVNGVPVEELKNIYVMKKPDAQD